MPTEPRWTNLTRKAPIYTPWWRGTSEVWTRLASPSLKDPAPAMFTCYFLFVISVSLFFFLHNKQPPVPVHRAEVRSLSREIGLRRPRWPEWFRTNAAIAPESLILSIFTSSSPVSLPLLLTNVVIFHYPNWLSTRKILPSKGTARRLVTWPDTLHIPQSRLLVPIWPVPHGSRHE